MANKGAIVLGAAAVGTVLVFVLAKKGKAAPPPGGYCCPYDSAHGCFDTYEELVAHVTSVHPGQRVPLEIFWV